VRQRTLRSHGIHPSAVVLDREASVADGESTNIPSPFDVRTIRYLVRLMGKYELSEIDLREGDLRIRLRRGGELLAGDLPSLGRMPPSSAGSATLPAAVSAPPPVPGPAPEVASKQYVEIKSPTPGTFYTASKPDAEPLVRVGTRVSPDTVVCIIEAMKVFNEIPAECSGTIVAVMVENQQPVEYGQVLFKVDPTG
jgi:acetyl-CoA carboxylase biotin carboxyl carrier protein